MLSPLAGVLQLLKNFHCTSFHPIQLNSSFPVGSSTQPRRVQVYAMVEQDLQAVVGRAALVEAWGHCRLELQLLGVQLQDKDSQNLF